MSTKVKKNSDLEPGGSWLQDTRTIPLVSWGLEEGLQILSSTEEETQHPFVGLYSSVV